MFHCVLKCAEQQDAAGQQSEAASLKAQICKENSMTDIRKTS